MHLLPPSHVNGCTLRPPCRSLCEGVANAQGQACREEENSGDEALSEPHFQRVLPLRRARPCAERDHHHHHRYGQRQAQPQRRYRQGNS